MHDRGQATFFIKPSEERNENLFSFRPSDGLSQGLKPRSLLQNRPQKTHAFFWAGPGLALGFNTFYTLRSL